MYFIAQVCDNVSVLYDQDQAYRRYSKLLGGIAAAAVLQGLLPGDLLVNCQPSNKIGTAQALFYGLSILAYRIEKP